MTATAFDRVRELVDQEIPVVLATVIRGEGIGSRMLVLPDSIEGSLGDEDLDNQVSTTARELLETERSESRVISNREIFFDVHPLPQHLVIFGAVHVAQPLSRYAQDLGFRVTVVDARKALATRERFPNVENIINAWPNVAYEQLKIGTHTWIAVLSHDPKFDEPAILGALKTPARYIGTVGSRKTVVDRRERLRESGVSDDDLLRLHGPIGLNIGGKTPEEMAISILGEMIAIRNGREADAARRDRFDPRGDPVSRIAGIVLAAGMSRRLGRPKQLLQLGDATVIEHVVHRALASSLDEVVVVLGARADDVRAALGGQPVRFVVNDRFAEGQGTSLAAGIASLNDDVEAAVVLLGDQPDVDPAVIGRVVQARRRSGASIVMAQYGDERGHPVLFGREHFSTLKALDGDQGGRDIIRHHISDVMTVLADSPRMPPDIDTEADWAAMLDRQRS